MARQFQHIVRVTGLRARPPQMFGKSLWWKERFVVTVTADDIRTVSGNALPEETRHVVITLLAGQFIIARRADGFWNLRICVQTAQRVCTTRKGIENPLVIERARDAQMIGVASDCVEIDEYIVHPAEFSLEHGLLLRLTQTIDTK